jgi:hypothetical protein
MVPVVPLELKLPDGLPVTVQLPLAGNPLNATLAVAVAHVGCVMVPIVGAEGVTGCALTAAFADATEVHPEALVTVNVYVVFAVKPVTVPVVPELIKLPDGLPVTVQLPLAGNPLNATLAVAVAHVGCVMVPIVGAVGAFFTNISSILLLPDPEYAVCVQRKYLVVDNKLYVLFSPTALSAA